MRIKAVPRAVVKTIVMATGPMSLAVLSIACTSAPPPEPPGSPNATPPATSPPITLVANLDQAPIEWSEVAFLPGGDGPDEIGLDPCFHCEAVVPAALAVAPDGTYWIADSYKRRIAHFAEDGSFIEAMPTERSPADLTFVGEHLYALEQGSHTIVAVDSGTLSEPVVMTAAGRPMQALALVGHQDQLLAWFTDEEEALGRFWATGSIDPTTGEVTPTPGVHVPGDLFMDLVPLLETRPLSYELRWSEDGQLIRQQEIRFQLVRDSRPVRTTVGDTYIRTSTPTGFATLVSIGDGQGLPVGVWYLEIPVDGGQPAFERIPKDAFIGDAIRYIALGPDGRIYWMRLLEDGLHIYRR